MEEEVKLLWEKAQQDPALMQAVGSLKNAHELKLLLRSLSLKTDHAKRLYAKLCAQWPQETLTVASLDKVTGG